MCGLENGLLWLEGLEKTRMAGSKAGRKETLTHLWCQAKEFGVHSMVSGVESVLDRWTTLSALQRRIRKAET